MNATRVIAMFLSLAFVFGLVSPGSAQAHATVNRATAHTVVLPAGDELADEKLADVRGEVAPWIVGGIVGGIGYVVSTRDQEKDAGWYARGAAAIAIGAVTGGVTTALVASAATTAGKVAAGVYSAAKGILLEEALILGGAK